MLPATLQSGPAVLSSDANSPRNRQAFSGRRTPARLHPACPHPGRARSRRHALHVREQAGRSTSRPARSSLLPVRAYTNHRVDLNFAKRFAAATAERFDRVVGFNKLTGLDFYYCGDPSILERGRSTLERSLPRHRVQTMLEAGILWTAAAHPNPGIDQIIGGELSPQLANTRAANHRAATVDRSGAPAARPAIRPASRGGACQAWPPRESHDLAVGRRAGSGQRPRPRARRASIGTRTTTLLVAGIAAGLEGRRSRPARVLARKARPTCASSASAKTSRS